MSEQEPTTDKEKIFEYLNDFKNKRRAISIPIPNTNKNLSASFKATIEDLKIIQGEIKIILKL